MISFKAKSIYPVDIIKLNDSGSFAKIPANFVELNTGSYEDICSLSEAAKNWYKENKGKMTFASSITADLVDNYTRDEYRFYGITTQMDGFKKLNPDEILGLAEIKPMTSKMHELVMLQTRPRDKFASAQRKFTGVGRALVESIIGLFPKKDMLVEPLCEARDFYFKLGFKSQILSRFLRHYAR